MSTDLKKITLDPIHRELGAKMVPFAGFEMPVSYTSLIDEHHTVRKAVGVFDVSHMGEFMVEGAKAIDLIQKVCSNDASKIEVGGAQYACFPNEKGGIVDDLIVYRLEEEKYMLVVNGANIEKDWAWLQKWNTDAVSMQDLSDHMSLFAVQGPKAIAAMQSLTDLDLSSLQYYTFKVGAFAGVENVIISATGYTGSGGLELYVKNENAAEVWNKVFDAGKNFGIKPIGLGARDTLRMEMGYCLYGSDIDDSTSPLEAGLGWITKFNKDFVNSASLKAQKEQGVTKKLVGFKMQERGIPRHDYELFNAQNELIGHVTSGTQSPSLECGIGLGYVKKEYSATGSELFVGIRNKKVKAIVEKLPLLKL